MKLSAPLYAVSSLLVGATAVAQSLDVDVPFVTTPDAVVIAMLEAGGVKKSDFLIDLGAGDGRIVIAAAQRIGARGLGVEIDPALVKQAEANAKRSGVAHKVSFRVEDLHKTDLSRATVITMYLLPEVNLQLRPKLLALKPGTRVVSHDWDMGDWQADDIREIPVPEKSLGREKVSRVYAWTVPARIAGEWCEQNRPGARLSLRQRYQIAEGSMREGQASQAVAARVSGRRIRVQIGVDEWTGVVTANRITLKNGQQHIVYSPCR